MDNLLWKGLIAVCLQIINNIKGFKNNFINSLFSETSILSNIYLLYCIGFFSMNKIFTTVHYLLVFIKGEPFSNFPFLPGVSFLTTDTFLTRGPVPWEGESLSPACSILQSGTPWGMVACWNRPTPHEAWA